MAELQQLGAGILKEENKPRLREEKCRQGSSACLIAACFSCEQ
jgi:hypothetical protein